MPVRSNVITLPRELTAAGASQANEAGTLTAQDAVLATQTINIRKQYGFRRYSNELLADADPAWNEFLANTLVRDVALSQDLQYLEGSGGAPQIQGLVGYTGLTSLSSGTPGAAPKGIVIEIPLWFSSQINIARTVGTSTNCTTVIIGRADQVLLLDRQGIEVAFSEHLYFNTDETAARAIARSAIAVITPNAVATIAGVKP
jgi:hypothetical protein